jgi:hypothetical protein
MSLHIFHFTDLSFMMLRVWYRWSDGIDFWTFCTMNTSITAWYIQYLLSCLDKWCFCYDVAKFYNIPIQVQLVRQKIKKTYTILVYVGTYDKRDATNHLSLCRLEFLHSWITYSSLFPCVKVLCSSYSLTRNPERNMLSFVIPFLVVPRK